MPRKYEPRSLTIESLLNWVKSGEIAIPEIQRPFVWNATKVRNLLDSLYNGYPVGYLIIWKNPDVNLKDGSKSNGKKILIDGQQRITALMAALLGHEVVTDEYKKVKIRIAFNPQKHEFEVTNTAIQNNVVWIPDIAELFAPDFRARAFVDAYCRNNPETDPDEIDLSISNLRNIVHNPIGIIELDATLGIEIVTEIFIRVNSEGTPLGQADFAMSKIAVNERHNGHLLRKAVDYFCHLAVAPEFYGTLKENDAEFAETEYFRKMAWLRNETDDLYDPAYADMLRVAFTSEFRRGRLEDLVALLSGRNFETRQYEASIVEATFSRLHDGIMNFMNESHFNRFVMIIKSAGFVSSNLIGSQMALNFAYILYLRLRNQGVSNADIERHVRRWYVMSVLTGRYSSNVEGNIDFDIRQIDERGIEDYSDVLIRGQLSDAFWDTTLPQNMVTSSANSPYFHVFRAAQVKLGDRGFLSRDISVRELVEHKSDVHHIFPRGYLKKEGLTRGQYNQIANYAITQSEINIAIGSKAPNVYFQQVLEQCNGGERIYGNITDPDDLEANLVMNCIPADVEYMTVGDYPDFLAARRTLMAQKIKTYFEGL